MKSLMYAMKGMLAEKPGAKPYPLGQCSHCGVKIKGDLVWCDECRERVQRMVRK